MISFPTPRSPWLATVAVALVLAACGSEATDVPAATPDTPVESSIDESGITEAPASVDADEPSDTADENPASDEPADAAPETPEAGAAMLAGGQLAPEGMRSVWSGTIGGRIGLTLALVQEGDLVRGELTYDSIGEPITVHGRAYPGGDAWLLREFADDGTVTGTLILGSVMDGVITDATWGEDDLELTFDGVTEIGPITFDPVLRTGRYEYAFAPFPNDDECCGPTGSLIITDLSDDTVTIEIENHTGAPAYNLAIIEPTTATLDGNVARYELSGDGVDCAFDIEVFADVAHVRHVDDRFDCLFGNAAGVEGIYVLTQPYVSAVDSPFADGVVLTSDAFGPVELGMTWAEMTERFGVAAYDPATADEISPGCNYLQVPGDPWSPWFMMLGEGEQSVVSRIELVRNDQATDAGIGLGSSLDDIRAAYDEVTEAPHVYLGDGALYVTVVDASDPDSTVLFETDNAGNVIAVRNGFADPIRWIEGCA